MLTAELIIQMILLVLPTTMIVFGSSARYGYPEEINHYYGYRSIRSMKSEEAWQYAQNYIGKWWQRLGAIVLVPVAIMLIFNLGTKSLTMYCFDTLFFALQIVCFRLPYWMVEYELEKKFD